MVNTDYKLLDEWDCFECGKHCKGIGNFIDDEILCDKCAGERNKEWEDGKRLL